MSVPVDINEIARFLNVTIDYAPVSYFSEEAASLTPYFNGYKITINSEDRINSGWTRFSCCHEFGHILIERYFSYIDFNKYGIYYETAQDSWEEERLCNEIAAEILVPSEMLRYYAMDKYPSLCSIDDLCDDFGVSRQTVIRRLLRTDSWRFGFVSWDIEDYVKPRDIRDPYGTISQDLISNIINESHALHMAASTGKPQRENWTNCIIEHFCTKSVIQNDKFNKVISLIFDKD